MRFLIIGDVHGYFDPMFEHLINVQNRGIEYDAVIQCGDFGFYYNCVKNLKNILYKTKFNKPIYFIDGNHEDHFYLFKEYTGSLEKKNIFYCKRGTITKFEDGTKIGWLGGAFNVDRPQEVWDGISNFPLPEEVELMINNIKKENGIDLMVTHSCPMNIGIGIVGHPEFQISAHEYISAVGYKAPGILDIGDEPLQRLWEELGNLKPKNWVFAHLHKYKYSKVGKTNFYCVGTCDRIFTKQQNIYIYDTKTKEILE